jgi:hypothetical protein
MIRSSVRIRLSARPPPERIRRPFDSFNERRTCERRVLRNWQMVPFIAGGHERKQPRRPHPPVCTEHGVPGKLDRRFPIRDSSCRDANDRSHVGPGSSQSMGRRKFEPSSTRNCHFGTSGYGIASFNNSRKQPSMPNSTFYSSKNLLHQRILMRNLTIGCVSAHTRF